MYVKELTQNKFKDLKRDYDVYGTHEESDKYNEKRLVRNIDPKCTINTMFQPLTDNVAIAEYGSDISSMYFCISYDPNAGIDYYDVVILFGDEYEVVGIKHFLTHDRIEVKKKVVE
jgi:hypothetical protein